MSDFLSVLHLGLIGVAIWVVLFLSFALMFRVYERTLRKKAVSGLWKLVDRRLNECPEPEFAWRGLQPDKMSQLVQLYKWLWWTPRVVDEVIKQLMAGQLYRSKGKGYHDRMAHLIREEFETRVRERALALAKIVIDCPIEELRKPAVYLNAGLGSKGDAEELEPAVEQSDFPEPAEALELLRHRLAREHPLLIKRLGQFVISFEDGELASDETT